MGHTNYLMENTKDHSSVGMQLTDLETTGFGLSQTLNMKTMARSAGELKSSMMVRSNCSMYIGIHHFSVEKEETV